MLGVLWESTGLYAISWREALMIGIAFCPDVPGSQKYEPLLLVPIALESS